MITGEIKNKIDKIWKDIWASGLTQPITVIEQLTYLIFIRSLDEKDIEAEAIENLTGEKQEKIFPETQDGQRMRWSKFKDQNATEIFRIISDEVFPFIKAMSDEKETAFSRYMKDATLGFTSPAILQKTIESLDDLYKNDIKSLDMQGDLYEYMLGKLSVAGQNGQFRTPKHIREMMVALREPTPDYKICDPACGTAGFLISSAEYIREHYPNMTDKQWEQFDTTTFSGYETDPTMLRISAMNLMLHSITHPDVKWMDSVSKDNEIKDKYDLILANPPFTGTIAEENISDSRVRLAKTKKTELLFLNLFVRMLARGGRCACIVPDGVAFGSSKAHKKIREELVEHQMLEGIISMPSGVFKPYAGVSTSILLFTKTDDGGTDKVWFYDMQADGFSLDDKRSPIEENDIPDIIERFSHLDKEANRKRTDKSFLVPKEEIVENGYDFSINKYKEAEYVPVQYPPTKAILKELRDIQKSIDDNMDELEKMLVD